MDVNVIFMLFKHYIKKASNRVFRLTFNLSITIHSSMKIHHGNIAYFAQQIVLCYDQLCLVKESIHACLMKSL